MHKQKRFSVLALLVLAIVIVFFVTVIFSKHCKEDSFSNDYLESKKVVK